VARHPGCTHADLQAHADSVAPEIGSQVAGYLKMLEERHEMIEKRLPVFAKPKARKGHYTIRDNFLLGWLDALATRCRGRASFTVELGGQAAMQAAPANRSVRDSIDQYQGNLKRPGYSGFEYAAQRLSPTMPSTRAATKISRATHRSLGGLVMASVRMTSHQSVLLTRKGLSDFQHYTK